MGEVVNNVVLTDSHANSKESRLERLLESVARKVRRRYWLRRLLRRHVFFHRFFSWILPRYQEYGVRPDTQVVIEGFPRCANTFAYVAFRMCQPGPVRIAHHLHSLGQVRRGVQLSIPTLVLIREPQDAVLSLAIRRGVVDVESLLVEYLDYYQGIAELGDAVVIADFSQVTSDYGGVIRRLNERFGTSFVEFEHTEDQLVEAYRLVDEQELAQTGAARTRSTHVARPTTDRENMKAQLLPRFETDRAVELLDSARRLYGQLATTNSQIQSESGE